MADIVLPIFLIIFELLVLCFDDVEAGSYCSSYRGFHKSSTYCRYGCCGSYHNRYCCSNNFSIIAGICFASIAAVCLLIACICCFIKKKGKKGRVVEPLPVAFTRRDVAVINTGAYNQPGLYYPPPPLPFNGYQPQQPPPYKASAPTPPPPAYSDPAYPPSTSGLPSAPPEYSAAGPSQPPANTALNGGGSGQPPFQAPPPGFNVGQA